MKNLNDAIKDLKDRLKDQKYTSEMLNEVADDWELNPVLLLRKFKELTGKDPSEITFSDENDLEQKSVQRAKDIAASWAEKNIVGGVKGSAVLGKVFGYEGILHVAAAWTSAGLHAVDVRNMEMMRIRFNSREYAQRYITQNVLNLG